MRECSEYEITVKQFANFCHKYTEKIKIHVVFSGQKDWKLKSPRMHDYYLTENLSGSMEELARVLKYYGDVPLWNLHVESAWESVTGRKGHFVCFCHQCGASLFEKPTDKVIAKRIGAIRICLNNIWNTGSTLQTCDYDFIENQLKFIEISIKE